ncbi:MAG TPA: hypothetical protein VEH04_00365 [Verrucomicrobiae bacterium]|nr:hypothetical protein [Verrucomicrobiae bacterium]
MTQTEGATSIVAPVEEIQQGWNDLVLRVKQLEVERDVLEHDNKKLRSLLERVIEHRQKSHGELILLLTGLVSKLPINDIGVVVSKLIEHNAHVTEVCGVLAKGKMESALPQPAVLKALDQTKRELISALKPLAEELIRLEAPLEPGLLNNLPAQPETFFSPRVIRATRCYIKGQVPRERIVREFGEEALAFFNDLTTDKKLNPNPRTEEIVLGFRNDFETLLQQNGAVLGGKRDALAQLYRRVQNSKGASDTARAQRSVFQKLSFILDLIHYYENQSTEAPDVIFAQRLPVLIEQFVLPAGQEHLDVKLIEEAESLLSFVLNSDYRHAVVNNIGKGGGNGRTLRYVLTLRAEKMPASDDVMHQVIPEFVKHLIPPNSSPSAAAIAGVLRLINDDMQRLVVRAIMDTDRLRKEDAEALGKAVGTQLGLTNLDQLKPEVTITPEMERQLAWEKIKGLITSRSEPGTIANAMRARLHAKYEADEIKQSWVTLTEADPISFIRVFCQLPYLADGSTDPVARAIMETYVHRLTHEKYASTYSKVMNSLKNMFRANPNSPTLLNFIALVRWVDAEAANKLSADVGMMANA